MAREQVKDLYKDRGYLPTIQPAARPVDTFVSPNKPTQDIRLLELARALQDVQPGLAKFANERIDHNNEINIEEGRKAALANKAQFKEAVNNGQIPAGASPWFRVGWQRQKAAVGSMEYDQALKEAYQKTNLSSSDNPEELSKFMAEFTADWLDKNSQHKDNPEFVSTFSTMAPQMQAGLQSQHAAIRVKAIEQEVIANTGKQLDATLQDYYDLLGNPNPNVSANLSAVIEAQVANGLNGTLANKLVTDSVIRAAEETGDASILDILNDVPSGSGSVGSIGYVRDQVRESRDRINKAQDSLDRHSKAMKKAKQEDMVDEVHKQFFARIRDNPYSDYTDLFTQMNSVDPDKASLMPTYVERVLSERKTKAKIEEPEGLKFGLLFRATKGEDIQSDVIDLVARRQLSAETGDQIITRYESATKNKTIVTNPLVTNGLASIGKVMNEDNNGSFTRFDENLAARTEQGKTIFLGSMIDWFELNPKATPKEIFDAVEQNKEIALKMTREDGANPLPDIKREFVAPNRQHFQNEESLRAAMAEYEASKANTGPDKTPSELEKLATQLGIPVVELVKQQAIILKKKSGPTK